MALEKEEKTNVIEAYSRHEKDTGSRRSPPSVVRLHSTQGLPAIFIPGRTVEIAP
jgi:ribosomal protein S15P/S13E